MTRWIEDLCDAVSVDAPDRYRWLGQTFVVAGTQSSISGTRPELISAVASCLYANFYCAGVPSPPETRRLDGPLPSARFRADLESAISEDRTLEPGWTVTSRQNDQLRVSRGGVTFRCLPKNVAVDEGVQVQLGDVVSIWTPSVRSGISPGFLSVLGPVSPRLGEPLRRYYWNVAPEGAPGVLKAICRSLNSLGVAYMLKALATPEDYSRRCDSVILYVPAAQRDTVEPALLPVLRAVADWVEPLTPAMTERLAPGLATADDPGNGESFGEVRCRAVAECIVEAWTDAAFSRPPDEVVNDLLAAHGINIDSEQASPAPRLPEIRGWWTRPDVSHIEAATDLAARISRSAIWWEGRCNWVAPDVDLDPNGHPVLRYVALGPHLYAGTSGIALSLAAAWWATGVDDFRRTAIGAARQTLAMLADVRSKECLLDGGDRHCPRTRMGGPNPWRRQHARGCPAASRLRDLGAASRS